MYCLMLSCQSKGLRCRVHSRECKTGQVLDIFKTTASHCGGLLSFTLFLPLLHSGQSRDYRVHVAFAVSLV
jgi:hypothetical protein